MLIPNLPFLMKKRELPFYGVEDRLPYLLLILLGVQQQVVHPYNYFMH